MPRPIWSGAISFGLVNVPVKVYPATTSKDVRFHMLHAKDGSRIEQRRICSADGEEVSWDHVVKGYEVEPGRYIQVTQEELELIAPKSTRSVEIEEFVELADIDPLLYESSYWLVPDKGAAKAYGLLVEAMRESGKVALGRVVLRSKQYLAAIRPSGQALTLSTMVFADEVVPIEEIPGAQAADDAGGKELEMATALVRSLEAPYDPTRYHDRYRERVLDLIETKAKGGTIQVEASEEEEPAEVVDLMAALEASLAAAKASGGGRGGDDEAAEKKPARRRSRKAASSS